jgi:DNA helicase II / ATP-dependent DNA helicase PcrA
MNALTGLVSPIDDEDVAWISRILGLRDLDASRWEFLTSMKSMDVAACPGSGKTTLVVAKLAILARKWQSRTSGICVLSHTNVARREIEERLSGTDVGHLLLDYPHYIDTIHGFANRFLAIPWLHSHGYPVTAIDNDITAAVRRRHMGGGFRTVETFLTRRYTSVDALRLASTDFDDPLGDNGFPARRGSRTYEIAAEAIGKTARQGYFRHDEMLMIAEALLHERSEVASLLPRRFPVLLIDEMQDTSAQQARIVETALPFSSLASVQRVGDPNQAIFDDGADESITAFPDPKRSNLSLPKSYRFDSSIASRASRLAVTPILPHGLQGTRVCGPYEPDDRHVIFVFPDRDPSQVIPAYAAHVLTVMKAAEVDDASVIAIGEVHRIKEEVVAGHPHFPASVSHYWSGYQPDAAFKTPRPKKLVNHVRAARALMADCRPAEAVNMLASGIARLANMVTGESSIRLSSRPHLALDRQLAGSLSGKTAYRHLLLSMTPDIEDSAAQWDMFADDARAAVGALIDTPAAKIKSDFLDWAPANEDRSDVEAVRALLPNTYRVSVGDHLIEVQLSSIHAVKGETHFATLVLETYYKTHSLKSLLSWLLGERQGSDGASKAQMRRLRLNYVAFTRSTHILCCAIPEAALGGAMRSAENTSRLAAAGWRVVRIGS